MGDGRADFEIKVASTVDRRGTEQADKDIKNLVQRTESLAAATKKAGEQENRTAVETKKAAAAHVQAAEAVKKHEEGLRGLAALNQKLASAKQQYKDNGGGIKGALSVAGSALGLGVTATGAVVATGAAAAAAAAAVAKESVATFAHTEVEVARLDQALANQGQLVERLRSKYQALARDLEKSTAISSDSWLETIRQLVQAGSTEETMERDINAVKALVGIYGNAEAAAAAWGKALHGQFDILREHGIILDQNATQAEKLKQAYEELIRRGGGQLEAQTKTLEGQWRAFKLSVDAIWREFGNRIGQTGAIQGGLEKISGALRKVSDTLARTVERAFGIKNVIGRQADAMHGGAEAALKFARGLDAINASANALAETLSGEQSAVAILANFDSARAKAAFENKLSFIDAQKIPDDQKEYLKQKATAQFEREQFQRDQQARADQVDYLEKQVANEDARVAAAKRKKDEAEAALKRDNGLSAELAAKSAPLQKELAALEARRKELGRIGPRPALGGLIRDAAGHNEELDSVDRQIAATRAGLEKLSASYPPLHPELAINAENARGSFKTIAEESAKKKPAMLEALGRARLEFDQASQVQQIEATGRFMTTPGIGDAVRGGNVKAVQQAMRDSGALVDQFGIETIQTARRTNELVRQLIGQMQSVQREVQLMKQQSSRLRNQL